MRTLAVETASEYLALDAATRRNLEITETLRGEPAPTLLSLLDTCSTAAGSRLLRHWLTHPLRAQDAAAARHAAIAALDGRRAARAGAGARARAAPPTSSASPRASRSLPRGRAISPGCATRSAALPAIAQGAGSASRRRSSPRSRRRSPSIRNGRRCSTRAIAAEPAAQVRDGGVIAPGFDAELDELRAIDDHCGEFLVALEARERERTGIANLKVEYNRVHGFYIEVTHANAQKIPDDYRRRQTLKNAERYITPELKAFEDRALSAQERALAREKVLYERLLADLAPAIPALQSVGAALAALDVLTTLAERAEALDFARPEFAAHGPRHSRRPASGRRAAGRRVHRERSRRSRPSAGCWSSPGRTWAASRRTCGRRR